MKILSLIVTLTTFFLAGCVSPDQENYNETGSIGALVSQDVGFDGNVCRYDNGQTVYTQSNCPSTVRNSVYTR